MDLSSGGRAMPFTIDQFFEVFARYNRGVWPAQIVLCALAALVVIAIVKAPDRAGRLVSAALALLWAWMAIAYHLRYFAAINPAARIFAGLFLAGAVAFALGPRLRFDPGFSLRGGMAWLLVLYALVGYPLIGSLLGQRYPAMPTFGLPCPTTIFTLGVLLLVRPPVPRLLFGVPILWSFLGAFAAFRLGVPEDLGLLVAGLAGLWAAAKKEGRLAGGLDPQEALRAQKL
jgi:hypothetical protein